MKPSEKTASRFTQVVTTRLLDSIKSGDKIDPELIQYAEEVINVHQLIVQLTFVGLIIDRLPQLSNYNEALDALIEELDTKDLSEASIGDKIRAASVLNQSIKTTVDVINDMMASKDAVNMLIASLKDTFGAGSSVLLEEGGAGKDLINKFNKMSAEKRQQLLAGAVTVIRRQMTENEDEDEG